VEFCRGQPQPSLGVPSSISPFATEPQMAGSNLHRPQDVQLILRFCRPSYRVRCLLLQLLLGSQISSSLPVTINCRRLKSCLGCDRMSATSCNICMAFKKLQAGKLLIGLRQHFAPVVYTETALTGLIFACIILLNSYFI
jgi:hypothetical protein